MRNGDPSTPHIAALMTASDSDLRGDGLRWGLYRALAPIRGRSSAPDSGFLKPYLSSPLQVDPHSRVTLRERSVITTGCGTWEIDDGAGDHRCLSGSSDVTFDWDGEKAVLSGEIDTV